MQCTPWAGTVFEMLFYLFWLGSDIASIFQELIVHGCCKIYARSFTRKELAIGRFFEIKIFDAINEEKRLFTSRTATTCKTILTDTSLIFSRIVLVGAAQHSRLICVSPAFTLP